ncbi:MAG: helix-turn-helix domain-containing protein [Thermoproteota archaeon]
MTLGEKEKEKTLENTLKEGGFTVSQKCCSRPSCFDFVARKSPHLIFINVQPDTEQVSSTDYLDLNILSTQVLATSLIISEKSHGTPLEDDTLYSKHNISVVTQKTFDDMILHKTYPLIQAGSGGYYVEVDGEAIQGRREELDLSLSELSEITGISQRTLYDYEQGNSKSTVSTAYHLIHLLGIPVAKSIDVFTKCEEKTKKPSTVVQPPFTENDLLKKMFQKLSGFNITTIRRAPFDFLVDLQKRIKIIGGVVNCEEQELPQRAKEILSVSRVAQACPLLVTEGCNPVNRDILCIPSEKISEIKNLEDLILTFK